MKSLLIVAIASLCLPSSVLAQKTKWDQEKAIEMVNQMLATEKQGATWDKNIAWSSEVEQVERKAKATGKPIFVYWYVKKVDDASTDQSSTSQPPIRTAASSPTTADLAPDEKLDKC
ncbi:MAG: hypothetical protein AAF497_06605 [Planctomycetota bacterium]